MSESTYREASGEAPPAPRTLTPDVERDARARGRVARVLGTVYSILGGTFLCIGLATLAFNAPHLPIIFLIVGGAFATIGGAALFAAWLSKQSAIAAFRDGVEARGTITDIRLDTAVRVNRRSPWRVRYEFMTKGGRVATGVATYWNLPKVDVGQEVVVIHDERKPSRNALWTRIEEALTTDEGLAWRVHQDKVRVEAERSLSRLRIGAVESNSTPEDEAATDEPDATDESKRFSAL